MTSLFLWFSFRVTTTWARQGELLGSMIPSFSRRWASASINFLSSWLYLRDFIAIGWQSVVRLAKSSGGPTFNMLSPQTSRGGCGPPWWKITLWCCFWKSSPSSRSAHKPGRIDKQIFESCLPPSSRSTVQNPRVLADSEDWAMVISLCSGYFGRFRDFKKNRGWMKLSVLQESIRALVLSMLITIY